jgi:trans-aconitate methyltransferase
MTTSDRQTHWQTVYQTKDERQFSWSQQQPEPSLSLIEEFADGPQASIIDIGGGASRLVDGLRRRGYQAITVLDLSQAALGAAKLRLGPDAAQVQWIAVDVTQWQAPAAYDIWHDRAAFHFLVEAADREAYLERLRSGVKGGGHAIIATFAPDGPQKCSGLAVRRYDPTSLSKVIGSAFELVDHREHRHTTPWGAVQPFQFSVLRRQ